MNNAAAELLIWSYRTWLKRFKWQWCGKLNFRWSVSNSVAHSIFYKWIGEIRRGEGTSQFSYARVIERRSSADNLRFLIWVGGLRDAYKNPWVQRWGSLAGEASIRYYRPQLGDLRYLLESAKPSWHFDMELRIADDLEMRT